MIKNILLTISVIGFIGCSSSQSKPILIKAGGANPEFSLFADVNSYIYTILVKYNGKPMKKELNSFNIVLIDLDRNKIQPLFVVEEHKAEGYRSIKIEFELKNYKDYEKLFLYYGKEQQVYIKLRNPKGTTLDDSITDKKSNDEIKQSFLKEINQ